jgi:hypothetical protein
MIVQQPYRVSRRTEAAWPWPEWTGSRSHLWTFAQPSAQRKMVIARLVRRPSIPGEIAVLAKKIAPCLWFNFNAAEAVQHYVSNFESGKVLDVSRYGDAVPGLKGKVLAFELEGQQFRALNGGPQFPFTEDTSPSVDCGCTLIEATSDCPDPTSHPHRYAIANPSRPSRSA